MIATKYTIYIYVVRVHEDITTLLARSIVIGSLLGYRRAAIRPVSCGRDF